MTDADDSGAVTIVDREWTGIHLVLTCPLMVMAALLLLLDAPAWLRRGETAAVVGWAAAGVIALWGCARAWRMQLRLDEHGVTVRNLFRTHRIAWPEIDRFEDGSRWIGGETPDVWALRVVRRDGRTVTSAMASRPGRSALRRRELLLDAVRQAAARHGVRAELTGIRPGSRS